MSKAGVRVGGKEANMDFEQAVVYKPTCWESWIDDGVEEYARTNEAPGERIGVTKSEGKTKDGYLNINDYVITNNGRRIKVVEEALKSDAFPDLVVYKYTLSVRDEKTNRIYRVVLPIVDEKYFDD